MVELVAVVGQALGRLGSQIRTRNKLGKPLLAVEVVEVVEQLRTCRRQQQ